MENVQFDYSKLKGRIREHFGTDKEFAEKIGVSPSVVSLKLRGDREFKQKDIFRWIEVLKIPDSEISDYFFTQAVKK